MKRQLSVGRSLALFTVLGLGGSLTTVPAAAEEPKTPRVEWGQCPEDVSAEAAPSELQCATVTVPLDYGDPGGERIDLTISRLAAADPDRRRGVLMLNPGGPGGSGLALSALLVAQGLPSSVTDRYDLIGMDTRGIGHSAPVSCGFTTDSPYYSNIPPYAVDDAAVTAQAKIAEQAAEQCADNDHDGRLRHLTTANTARDLDRIRAALGDEKLNYVGMSYGTQLGAVYATQFPGNVGRMVLDAPLDPTVSFEERTLAQTRGFQQVYESFLKACVKERCAIGATVEKANANVEKLLGDLTERPLKVGGRELTQGLATTGIAAALYSELSWPFLETALGQALKGKGGALLYLADSYTGRSEDGRFSTQMTSFPAITCVDTTERPDRETLRRTEEAALRISPLFGSEGSGGVCSVWPVPGDDAAKRVDATGSAPILVVGGKNDPATPYEWAPRLTEQLKTATLLTYEGEGHGAYLSGNECVTRQVDAYLIQGKLPARGATCTAA